MKKTLFLSAILATALCSSAFATNYTSISANQTITTAAGDTISGLTMQNNSAFVIGGNTTSTGNIQVSNSNAASITINEDAELSFTNTGAYCLQLNNSAQLTLSGGTFDVTTASKGVAIYGTAALTLDNKATLKAKEIYYSSGNNGSITMNQGTKLEVTTTANCSDLTMGADTSVIANNVAATGTVSMASGAKMTINSAFAPAKLVMDSTASLTSTSTGWVRLSEGSSVSNVKVVNMDFKRGDAYTVDMYGTNAMSDQLDLAGGNQSGYVTAGLKLKENATLSVAVDRLWLGNTSRGITFEKNAELTYGNIQIKGLSSAEGSLGSLVRSTGSASYNMSQTSAQISNALVTVTATGDYDSTLYNKLVNVAVTYANTTTANKTLKLNNTNTLTDVTLGNGATLEIVGGKTSISGTAKLNGMTIAAGADLTLSGSTTISGTALTNNSTLTLGDVLLSTGTSTLTQSGSGTLKINGVITTAEGMTGGKNNYALILNAGKLEFGNGTNAKETDIRDFNIGGVAGSSILVKNGYSLTAKGVIYTSTNINNNSTVEIESGASLSTNGNIYAAALTNEGSLTAAYLQTKSLNLLGGNATISGNVDVVNKDSAVGSLTLSNGADITAETISGKHNGIITTTTLTVTDAGSEMNADLVIRDNGTLTFADGAVLTMGCDVTIGNDVTVVLTDTMVESIMAGNDVEIIAGVDKAYLSQSLTFIGSGTMSDYVAEHEAVYSLKQVGDKIYITPEPATATLSLLALAALAARRRRH